MLRELDKYLFRKMVVDRSDSEIEEELAGGTFTISYLLNGEEIGIALRKSEGGTLIKRWQVLSKASFGNQVTSGLPLDVWEREQENQV